MGRRPWPTDRMVVEGDREFGVQFHSSVKALHALTSKLRKNLYVRIALGAVMIIVAENKACC